MLIIFILTVLYKLQENLDISNTKKEKILEKIGLDQDRLCAVNEARLTNQKPTFLQTPKRSQKHSFMIGQSRFANNEKSIWISAYANKYYTLQREAVEIFINKDDLQPRFAKIYKICMQLTKVKNVL